MQLRVVLCLMCFCVLAPLLEAQVVPIPPDTLRPHDKPAATPETWFVQVGAFTHQENAQRLATRLEQAGYAIDLFLLVTGRRQLMTVRVGGYPTETAARVALAELRRKHHLTGFIVTQ